MKFISYLESIIPVSDQLKEKLLQCSQTLKVTKGETLIRKGERSSTIFFIESGLLRGYYFNEDKEVTHWFASEGEFATSFYSFIANEKSLETIQAIENCELVGLSYANLQSLYHDFTETERIGRLLTEHYYIKLEGRFLSIQFKTAKERYQHLLSTNASLIQRTSLGQIASYLGITQETLSRIRAEL